MLTAELAHSSHSGSDCFQFSPQSRNSDTQTHFHTPPHTPEAQYDCDPNRQVEIAIADLQKSVAAHVQMTASLPCKTKPARHPARMPRQCNATSVLAHNPQSANHEKSFMKPTVTSSNQICSHANTSLNQSSMKQNSPGVQSAYRSPKTHLSSTDSNIIQLLLLEIRSLKAEMQNMRTEFANTILASQNQQNQIEETMNMNMAMISENIQDMDNYLFKTQRRILKEIKEIKHFQQNSGETCSQHSIETVANESENEQSYQNSETVDDLQNSSSSSSTKSFVSLPSLPSDESWHYQSLTEDTREADLSLNMISTECQSTLGNYPEVQPVQSLSQTLTYTPISNYQSNSNTADVQNLPLQQITSEITPQKNVNSAPKHDFEHSHESQSWDSTEIYNRNNSALDYNKTKSSLNVPTPFQQGVANYKEMPFVPESVPESNQQKYSPPSIATYHSTAGCHSQMSLMQQSTVTNQSPRLEKQNSNETNDTYEPQNSSSHDSEFKTPLSRSLSQYETLPLPVNFSIETTGTSEINSLYQTKDSGIHVNAPGDHLN